MAGAGAKERPIGWLAFNHADRVSKESIFKRDSWTLRDFQKATSFHFSNIAHIVQDREDFQELWAEAEAIEEAGPQSEQESWEDVQWSAQYKRWQALQTAGSRAGVFDNVKVEERDFYGRATGDGDL